jgi:hypothetical protein
LSLSLPAFESFLACLCLVLITLSLCMYKMLTYILHTCNWKHNTYKCRLRSLVHHFVLVPLHLHHKIVLKLQYLNERSVTKYNFVEYHVLILLS